MYKYCSIIQSRITRSAFSEQANTPKACENANGAPSTKCEVVRDCARSRAIGDVWMGFYCERFGFQN
jgi:hypothetical protein